MTGSSTSGRYRVYLAGPIRTSGGFMENISQAIEAAETVHEAGHVPFIPHTHNQQWDLMFPKSRTEWLDLDLHWVETCDVLVRLEGESVGADAEMEHAERNGIPVFYGVDAFLNSRYQDTASEQPRGGA